MDLDELLFYGTKDDIEVTITEPEKIIRNRPIKYKVKVRTPESIGVIFFDDIGNPMRIRDGFKRRLVPYDDWCNKYMESLIKIVPQDILAVLFDDERITFPYMVDALEHSKDQSQYPN